MMAVTSSTLACSAPKSPAVGRRSCEVVKTVGRLQAKIALRRCRQRAKSDDATGRVWHSLPCDDRQEPCPSSGVGGTLVLLQAGDHGDDLVLVSLLRLANSDLLSAPHNADSVGQPEHLVEAVAND